jgi:hypothetical protein
VELEEISKELDQVWNEQEKRRSRGLDLDKELHRKEMELLERLSEEFEHKK